MSKIDEIKKLANEIWSECKDDIKSDFLKHGDSTIPEETICQLANDEADSLTTYIKDCMEICHDYNNQKEFSFNLPRALGKNENWTDFTANLSKIISNEIIREVLNEKFGKEIDSWRDEYNNKATHLKNIADEIWEENKGNWKEDYLKDGKIDQAYADIDDIAINDTYFRRWSATEFCEHYFAQEAKGIRVNYQDGIDADVSPDNWRDHADQLAKVISNEVIRQTLLDHVHQDVEIWQKEYDDRKISGPGM